MSKQFIPNFKELSPKEWEAIKSRREFIFDQQKSTPKEGRLVDYIGLQFLVYPNVFYPHSDSELIVRKSDIRKGDEVLDVGTGSGVIAVFSAYKGAKRVVAVDINPDAVKTAKENARRHGFEEVMDVRLSNGFEAVEEDELFDVITANLPFTDMPAEDYVQGSIFDTDFALNKNFFENAGKHLKPGGRIYMSQANFGNPYDMLDLAEKRGFKIKFIGETVMPLDPRVFYAFELTRN